MARSRAYAIGLLVRRTLFVVLSAALGCTLAAVLIFAAEWFLRTWPQPAIGRRQSEYGTKPSQDKKIDSPTQIPIHLPPPFPQPAADHYVLSRPTQYPNDYFFYDPWTGPRMRPGFKGYVMQKSLKGELNYNVYYEVDPYGHRFTPGQSDSLATDGLLLIGCSFTFGEGVGQQETIAAKATQFLPHLRTYNYGVHGWGPANHLRWASTAEFAQEIPKSTKGKVVYLFMDHHINRLLGSLDVYRAGFDWEHQLPYYYLDENGALQTDGMMDTGRPWTDWFYKNLAKSELLKYFSVNLPYRFSHNHLRLFTAVVSRLKTLLAGKLPEMEFYVAFYPGSRAAPILIPYLDEVGINSLDYSTVHLYSYLEAAPTTPDGHPSAATNKFLARQILTDLGMLK